MKVWYSFFQRDDYKGNEPFFVDPDGKEWVKILEENSALIKQELLQLLGSKDQFQPYFNSSAVGQKLSWKTIAFRWWGIEFFKNQKKCPATTKAINSIPNLVSASFSLLEPHSEILPHCGDTNGIYRAHLGLIIPASLPLSGFRVGNEVRSWEEGKMLIFCDAHKHSAFNNSEHPRVILIVDIIRDECANKKRRVCANVMASLFLQKRLERFPKMRNAPQWLGNIFHFGAKVNAIWFIPVRNFFYRLLT